MSFSDKYKKRVTRNGKDIGEAYNNNTIAFKEATFSASPTFRILDVVSKEFPNIKKIDARVIEVERMGTLREILFRHNQGLNIGTYVKFDGDTWLIFDKWGSIETGLKVMAEKCNRTIKWVKGDKTVEKDCIASSQPLGSKANQGKMDIEWNKYDVRLPMGQLYCFVELDDNTRTIHLNQRFIFGSNVYEVVGVDDTTTVDTSKTEKGFGVLQLTLKITTKRSEDDFENRIATQNLEEKETEPTPPSDDEDTGTGGSPW